MRIIGVTLVAISVLTFLSLIPLNRGVITGEWIRLLQLGFGWGGYVAPAIIGFLGVWLVLRSVERVENPNWAKWGGVALLLVSLLGLLHAFTAEPRAWAEQGRGGGYLGFYIRETLSSAVGQLGMIVLLLTGVVVAVLLAFELSAANVAVQAREIAAQLLERYRAWRERRAPMPAVPKDTSLPARFVSQSKGEGDAARRDAAKPVAPSSVEGKFLQPRIIGGGGEQKWQLPNVSSILEDSKEQDISQVEIRHRVRVIEETLTSFGVPGKVTEVNQGPTITQFGVEPGYVERRDGNGKAKIKVNQISSLAKDLELALAASPIRIEAPVPGRSVVGIEVPNAQVSVVSLRGVMESDEFKNCKGHLMIALGRDVSGQPIVADLAGHAPFADRGRHRLRQIGLHQCDHCLTALYAHARDIAADPGGSQDGRVGQL